MLIDPRLLEILACPLCKSEIREEGLLLRCSRRECSLAYKVEDGIPIMLVEEAVKACPECGAERAFRDEELVCGSCGARFKCAPGSG